jgi:hypothetical protein
MLSYSWEKFELFKENCNISNDFRQYFQARSNISVLSESGFDVFPDI